MNRQHQRIYRVQSASSHSQQRASNVAEAIRQNHLIELAYIENTRRRYSIEELTICVDQVEGLGDFIEIEASCEEGEDTSQLETRVQSFANGLMAKRLQIGYVELWLQKH